MSDSFRLTDILDRFTSPSVPDYGKYEAEVDDYFWDTSKNTCLQLGDLSKYPLLYVGEGHNTIYLINDGKIIWKYDTGKGYELDDIWMLSNGNILFTHMYWCAGITPEKDQYWYYKVPEGCEVHALQPIGLDKVAMIQNGKEPKVIIMDTATNAVEYEHVIPYDPDLPIHSQFRRMRITKDGNFLICYMDMHKVVEFDREFNIVWQYETERPWSACRLLNGNTLITDETLEKVIEVNPSKETVWEFSLDQIDEKHRLIGSQSCVRLENGNTILCSQGNYGEGPQLVEVTKDKKTVWCVNDWEKLGPATTIQVLSEKGIPEIPGECQR